MSDYKDDKNASELPEDQPASDTQPTTPPETAYESSSEDQQAVTEEVIVDDREELDRQVEEEEILENTASLEDNVSPEDLEYMSDTSAAMLMKAPTGGRLLIYTMLLAIGSAITWASLAPLDEITRGMGEVVPSSHLQVIQNFEGGILEELYVREGELVKEGQPLLQLDDTRFKSTFREGAVEYYSELARAARLRAELSGNPLKFPPQLNDYQDYVDREIQIYQRRDAGLKAELDIVNKQASQAKHELAASESQLEFLTTSLELGEEELELTNPLAEQGVVSHVEMIQLKQRVNDLASEKNMTELSIPKLSEAYQEALARKRELTVKFREEVVQELKESEVKLDQMSETQTSLEDQVVRTLLRSPVEGIVKKINVKTVGGVIQPGMDVMEIVPVEESLLVEAQIAPKDIGFLREGMKSVVKLTAYDFAVYGGLEGVVDHISADTIKDEKGESFYIVRVRTHENQLGNPEKPLEIIPGMKANIDIITGEKTLMEYLMKPILRARQNALTER
ncbi:HlyD family type I secretion periplasmic adaptor subunit [Endozoicomonas sp. 4G]|uniref:HlyD family type I secretion periplasmic adaptor subunit n=1 Tax=Endozoicomonas sp. 4G TaxID=2872754 RepID=UPI002078BB5A|nr:HlyD family type I secretion periplasmic adaptor subunit [Endozoicomonas sp. 4G]